MLHVILQSMTQKIPSSNMTNDGYKERYESWLEQQIQATFGNKHNSSVTKELKSVKKFVEMLLRKGADKIRGRINKFGLNIFL